MHSIGLLVLPFAPPIPSTDSATYRDVRGKISISRSLSTYHFVYII